MHAYTLQPAVQAGWTSHPNRLIKTSDTAPRASAPGILGTMDGRRDRGPCASGMGGIGSPVSTVSRSVSMPQELYSGQPKGSESLRTPPLKNGLRLLSESRSLSGQRGQPGISDLCADLVITDSIQDDRLTGDLRSVKSSNRPGYVAGRESPACQRALGCTDILYLIFGHLDSMNVVPHELSQRRRKPMSLRHAHIIYGDTARAVEAWERAKRVRTTTSGSGPGAGLYACLQVNKKWSDVAQHVLAKNIFFSEEHQWRSFTRNHGTLARKPTLLVLHKLVDAHQIELEKVMEQVGGNLEWLEFYTCPRITLTAELLGGGRLTKIVLPGCPNVTDYTMALIATHCPALKQLDLRACEELTDKGLKMVARHCPGLQLVNVGRTRGGEHITYKGIKHLARLTDLKTLGVAGCHIDDRAIWELALNRGPHLQRLSLNNCRLLTNAGVPRVLTYMPELSVLEIRGCTQISDMKPLALFKRYREQQGHPSLIEGCEVIERRIQVAIYSLKLEMSQIILRDLLSFVNGPDTDMSTEAYARPPRTTS